MSFAARSIAVLLNCPSLLRPHTVLLRRRWRLCLRECSIYLSRFVTLIEHQGHLFDRRMVGRILKHEWGQDIDDEDDSATRCVRRFGRLKRAPHESSYMTHVTGAKMADSNGNEVRWLFTNSLNYWLMNFRRKAASECVLSLSGSWRLC